MATIGSPGSSPEKKAELWERWKSGQCASDIARSPERTNGAIHPRKDAVSIATMMATHRLTRVISPGRYG